MNQDITIFPSRSAYGQHTGAGGRVSATTATLPASPEELWGAPGHTALAPANGAANALAQNQGLRKLHRMLRGRYLIGLLVATLGAFVGAVVGYKTTTPLYTSSALVEVRPTVLTSGMMDKVMPFYTNFVKGQAAAIQDSRVITLAMKQKEYTDLSKGSPTPGAVAAFRAQLSASYIKDSQYVQVNFSDPDPRKATAGCTAVLKAYEAISSDVNSDTTRKKLEYLEQKKNAAQANLRKNEDVVNDLSKNYGGPDIGPLLLRRQEELQKIENAKWAAELELASATSQLAGPDGQPIKTNVQDLTPQQLAQIDPEMAKALNYMNATSARLGELRLTMGDTNPKVQLAVKELHIAVDNVNATAKQIRDRILKVTPKPDGNITVIRPETVEGLKAQVAILHRQYAAAQDGIQKMGDLKREIDKRQEDVQTSKSEMDKCDRDIAELQARMQLSGQITIGPASEPSADKPDIDKRPQMMLAGGVLGAALPIGLVLLIGLLDSRRYSYSDDAGGDNMNGLTLLGILPELPDRLSDPAQASIAAHCVHQIRTMLQLSGHEARRAFAITSATSGDGKTSLSLALGLSFAASGSRTLLIDADLVGAGLTSRLGMSGPEGILEAMTTGNLLNYVRSTDVADLSILPVGLAQLHHAGIFSPAAVRRLLAEAKKHFEIIIVDTGPILGSIEATPVSAAVEGVILTVAHGQKRPAVEKALEHLRSIGARVAGVVFNRAQARDFESSISGISMRSASRAGSAGSAASGNGRGHNSEQQAGQYGPVARAVATSVRPGSEVAEN
jgi:capsular exopolysaccharide synthesis family protein